MNKSTDHLLSSGCFMAEKYPSAEMYIINAPVGGSSLNPATTHTVF